MHIALLMANTDESAFAQARPRDGEKWASLLAGVRPDWRLSVFAVKDGVFPERLDGVDGWIVSGSPASANDPDPWVDRLMGLIRDLAGRQAPVFGACFGHQAIARALGGQVSRNPGGFVLGVAETVYPAAGPGADPLRVALHAAHGEQVSVLPPGARVLAGNADCPVGAFAIRDHILTTQYHPEITREFMADLIDEIADRLPPAVIARARASMVQPADHAIMARWIATFLERG